MERPEGAVDFTKLPEFQAALSEAVGKALADALEPLKDRIAAAKAGETVEAGLVDSSGAEGLLQRLAHLIGEVSDQGSGKPQKLPPEVMARRDASRIRMFEALADMRERVAALRAARKNAEAMASTPRYRALTNMWLGERMIQPFRMDALTRQPIPVEFYWSGAPNQAMLPLNPSALVIFGHYRDWIGGVDTSVAKPGWISPGGVVVLVGEKSTPPITAMQRNGFQPDYGDTDLDEGFPEPDSELTMADAYSSHGVVDPRARKINVLGTVAPAVDQGHPNDVVRRGL